VVNFVTMVPTVLTTVLFALKPGDGAAMRHQVRFTMGISGLVAATSAPLIFVGARFALSLFSQADVSASTALWILGLTTFPWAVKAHYVAVARVANRLARAALFSSLGAVVEIALAIFGGVLDGVNGMAIGWLIALCIEAVIFGPTVLRALRRGALS
jgi:O-antigen/teichoic acid export membrane protein